MVGDTCMDETIILLTIGAVIVIALIVIEFIEGD